VLGAFFAMLILIYLNVHENIKARHQSATISHTATSQRRGTYQFQQIAQRPYQGVAADNVGRKTVSIILKNGSKITRVSNLRIM
jgi:hypothetical protein